MTRSPCVDNQKLNSALSKNDVAHPSQAISSQSLQFAPMAEVGTAAMRPHPEVPATPLNSNHASHLLHEPHTSTSAAEKLGAIQLSFDSLYESWCLFWRVLNSQQDRALGSSYHHHGAGESVGCFGGSGRSGCPLHQSLRASRVSLWRRQSLWEKL